MADEQTQLHTAIEELFNKGCNYTGFGSYTFTGTERSAYLTALETFIEGQRSALDPLWLTRQLLRTEGKFASSQERAAAIVGGKA